MISEAALHVEDALAHRQLRVRSADTVAINEYKTYYQASARIFVQFVNVLHMLLVLFEPNDRDGATYASLIGGQVQRSTVGVAVLVIEGIILVVLTADLYAKMRIIGSAAFFNWAWMFKRWARSMKCCRRLQTGCSAVGRKMSKSSTRSHQAARRASSRNFVRRDSAQTCVSSISLNKPSNVSQAQMPHFLTEKGHFWDMVRCICLLLFWLDLILMLSVPNHFQFSRIFRPVVFIAYSGELRRWVYLIGSLVPKFMEMFCLLLLVICIWGAVGVLLFHDDIAYVDNPSGENFNSIWAAALALFALYTSESYPDIMYPSFQGSATFARVYSVYFLSFVVAVMFILANLIVPVLYTSFKSKRRLLALYMHVAQRRGLMSAFSRLKGDSGTIEFDVFTRLVKHLRPELLEENTGTASNHDFQCAVQLMVVEMQSLAQQNAAADDDTESISFVSRAASVASRPDSHAVRARSAQIGARHQAGTDTNARPNASLPRTLSGKAPQGIATMTAMWQGRQARSASDELSDEDDVQVLEVVPRRQFAKRAASVSTSDPATGTRRGMKARDPSLKHLTGLADIPDSPTGTPRSSTVSGITSRTSIFAEDNSPISAASSAGGPANGIRPSPSPSEAGSDSKQQREFSKLAPPPLHGIQSEHAPIRLSGLSKVRGRKRVSSFAVVTEDEVASQLRGTTWGHTNSLLGVERKGRPMDIISDLPTITSADTSPARAPGQPGSGGRSAYTRQASLKELQEKQEQDLLALEEENCLGLFEFFEVVEVLGRKYKRISQRQFLKGRGGRRLVSRVLSKGGLLLSPLATLVLAAVSPLAPSAARNAMLGVVGVIALEKMCLMYMQGPRQYIRRTAELVDWAVLLVSMVAFGTAQQLGYGLSLATSPPLSAPQLQERQLADLWIMVLCLRGFRIFNLIPNFRELLVTTRSVLRFLAVAVSILLLLMYAFGLLGVFLFAGRVAYRTPAFDQCFAASGTAIDGAGGVCTSLPSFADGNVHFDTFASGLFTLFQVLTTSNWHEVMYLTMWGVPNKAAAALYFLAFYITAVSFIFNLVVAVFIDSFENARSVIKEKRRFIRDALTGNGSDVFWKIKGLASSNTLTAFLDTPDGGNDLQSTIQALSEHLKHEVGTMSTHESSTARTLSSARNSANTDSLALPRGVGSLLPLQSPSIELPARGASLKVPAGRHRHPSLSPQALPPALQPQLGEANQPQMGAPPVPPTQPFFPTIVRRPADLRHGMRVVLNPPPPLPPKPQAVGATTRNPMTEAATAQAIHDPPRVPSHPPHNADSLRKAGKVYRAARAPSFAAPRRTPSHPVLHPSAHERKQEETSRVAGGNVLELPPPDCVQAVPVPVAPGSSRKLVGVVARVARPRNLYNTAALPDDRHRRRNQSAGGGSAGEHARPASRKFSGSNSSDGATGTR